MVKPEVDGLGLEKLSASVNGGQDHEAPIPDWVQAVAMIAAKNMQAAMESKSQLPEDVSATDLDFVRLRALSSQI